MDDAGSSAGEHDPDSEPGSSAGESEADGSGVDGSGADGPGGAGTEADGVGRVARTGSDLEPTVAARRLLEAYRTDSDPDPYLSTMAGYDDVDLARIRETSGAALAFWSNLYNAGTQRLLAERPELYDSRLRFFRFFRVHCVAVAGTHLNLDTIEHGVLRGARSKYGLGYLPRVPRRFERRYRLADTDPRVHFALNCGAASCPPIRAYEADRVDEQLELATESHLERTVEYDPDGGVAEIPRLFLWYRGDFGGRPGIRRLLREHGAIPDGATPRLSYRSWDWSRDARNFVG